MRVGTESLRQSFFGLKANPNKHSQRMLVYVIQFSIKKQCTVKGFIQNDDCIGTKIKRRIPGCKLEHLAGRQKRQNNKQ